MEHKKRPLELLGNYILLVQLSSNSYRVEFLTTPFFLKRMKRANSLNVLNVGLKENQEAAMVSAVSLASNFLRYLKNISYIVLIQFSHIWGLGFEQVCSYYNDTSNLV